MATRQLVVVKGSRSGIGIILDENVEFKKLKEALREKVAGARQFFDGATTNISFKGRLLEEDEEQELLDIILAETEMEVGFVEGSDFIAPSTQNMPKILKPLPPPPEPAPIQDSTRPYSESPTAYYRNGLRSGQSIKYHGSVVIMGDVNPGSEVVAGGNVVVLGALKGMAHAGSRGDTNYIVSALVLQPTQLRIGSLITYIPKPEPGAKRVPSFAYVKDNEVFVSPL